MIQEKHVVNLDDLESELDEMKLKKEQMEKEIENLNSNNFIIEQEIDTLKLEIERISATQEELKAKFSVKKEEQDVLNMEIKNLQNKCDIIKKGHLKSQGQLEQSLIRWNALLATLQERESQLKKDGDSTEEANRPPRDIDHEIKSLEDKLKNSVQLT